MKRKIESMSVLNGIDINVKRVDVLETLKSNRDNHIKIVEEAKIGFVEKAQAALNARLSDFKEGKNVDLTFNIFPPKDYTNVYDTAIRMFELAADDTVTLNDEQIANLVMDNWNWTGGFLQTNAQYSAAAREGFSNFSSGTSRIFKDYVNH